MATYVVRTGPDQLKNVRMPEFVPYDDFTAEDLAEIDGLANEEQINLWAKSSEEA